jgi:hypothetical protein
LTVATVRANGDDDRERAERVEADMAAQIETYEARERRG